MWELWDLYNGVLSLTSTIALFLFLPSRCVAFMRIEGFVTQYRPELWAVFVFGCAVLFVWSTHYIRTPKQQQAHEELNVMRLEIETRSIAQAVLAVANELNKSAGVYLCFSENQIRGWLPEAQGLRLWAALDLLNKDGEARRAEIPGEWLIGHPKQRTTK